MRSKSRIVVAGFLMIVAAAVLAGSKPKVTPDLYKGKDPEAAARALLELGEVQAGKGSWEIISVGYVYYSAGFKDEGQALFDRVTNAKPEGGDWMRIGRSYNAADDWENAKAAFAKALELQPDDADWLAEIGSYHNLHGDRETAEKMFDRSFASAPNDLRNTLAAAGSYVGVPPRGR